MLRKLLSFNKTACFKTLKNTNIHYLSNFYFATTNKKKMSEEEKHLERVQIAAEVNVLRVAEGILDTPHVKGWDFNNGVNYSKMFTEAYLTTGFQAMYMAQGIAEINKMIKWRLSDEAITEKEDEDFLDPEVRKNTRCSIYLGYTSNMISCGVRETIRYLCEHKMIDAIVTTCGGIEEDFMKCMAPTHLGDFALKGADLRKQGINRIGNLLISNNNYCMFEDWLVPILDQFYKEQQETGEFCSPSKLINRMGKEINNPESVYYWCYKNDIPVFCPAITDGSIGDMLYFHSYKKNGLVMDLVQDIRKLTDGVLRAHKSGMIILGGGVVKHHICNANMMRNGANFSVFVNTGQEFDGSDAGARPDEAVSWGKIRPDATPVKVYTEASLVFPVMVAETFVKNYDLAARVKK